MAAGRVGERLAVGHARRAEADALAVAVELLVRRAERAVRRRPVDGRAAVRVAVDRRVAVRVAGHRVAGLAGAAVRAALGVDGGAVERARGGPGARCRAVRPGRARTRWPRTSPTASVPGAPRPVFSSARCELPVSSGAGEVLGRQRPEVVPVVADRDVRAEEAEPAASTVPMVACRPRSDPFVAGAVDEPVERVERLLQRLVELRHAAPAPASPRPSARVDVRQRARAARPRAASRSVESAGRCARGTGAGRAASACPRRACPAPWRSCPCSACGSREIAPNVSAIVVNRRAFVFDTGATTRAASSSSEKKPWMFGLRVGEVRHDRGQAVLELGQPADRLVEVGAAAVEGVAEADEVVARRLARRRVEHARAPGRARPGCASGARERRAVGERAARDAAVELDVLQAERRARPDASRASRPGRRRACWSSFSVSCAPTLPPGSATGLHRRDDADAEAARAHLVARDEVRAVGEVDLELRRRHERQARVRVVGEEDGDDDHEHRHRADEHGVRDDGGAVVRRPRSWPEEVVEELLRPAVARWPAAAAGGVGTAGRRAWPAAAAAARTGRAGSAAAGRAASPAASRGGTVTPGGLTPPRRRRPARSAPAPAGVVRRGRARGRHGQRRRGRRLRRRSGSLRRRATSRAVSESRLRESRRCPAS